MGPAKKRADEKGADEKRADEKKREKEHLEAETAIPERQKFLDAAKQKAEPELQTGDRFAEFGGSSSYPKNSTAFPPQRPT